MGCADIFSLSGQAAAEEEEAGSGDCGPIAAGPCPELHAACRRGCRPGLGRPPPLNTHSSLSHYSEPRSLEDKTRGKTV